MASRDHLEIDIIFASTYLLLHSHTLFHNFIHTFIGKKGNIPIIKIAVITHTHRERKRKIIIIKEREETSERKKKIDIIKLLTNLKDEEWR